jgi:hypothetical protein
MKFATKSLEYIGAQYCAHGFSKDEGYDCFSLVINFLRENGFDLPEDYEWKGLSFQTYYYLWLEDKDAAIQKMAEFLDAHTDKIKFKDVRIGDIFIVVNKEDERFCGVYGGNDKIITALYDRGVVAISLRHFEIIDIYRGHK